MNLNKIEEQKVDFLGKVLSVGDTVVFMQIGYRNFLKGKIVKMSNKKATIEHERANIGGTQTLQFYNQLIKV